jgi:hypothetical protein
VSPANNEVRRLLQAREALSRLLGLRTEYVALSWRNRSGALPLGRLRCISSADISLTDRHPNAAKHPGPANCWHLHLQGQTMRSTPTIPDGAVNSRRPFVLGAVMLASFMIAIEATIVATAMPGIVRHLGGLELYSWVFSSFLLAQTATTVMFGKMADLFGRKHVLLVGIAIFGRLGPLRTRLVHAFTDRVPAGARLGSGSHPARLDDRGR